MPRYKTFFCMLFCLCIMLWSISVYSAENFQPGFKTVGLWDEANNMRMDLNVWYPSLQNPSLSHYTPWVLDVVRYGNNVPGRFPLIVLSHASTATRFSYHESAAALACSGFVVIALEHNHDNMYSLSDIFTLRQITERVAQLRYIIHAALTHKELQNFIDPKRIGILGFEAGGTTALVLGGAVPQAEGWENYCTVAGNASPYCSPWARGRMQKMVYGLPLFKENMQDFIDPQIKAIVAVAPLYDMFFTQKALQSLVPPLLLINVEKNIMGKSTIQNVLAPHTLVTIPEAGVADLMSLCPPALQKDLPEMCGTVSPDVRKTVRTKLDTYVIQFFVKTLGSVQ